MRNMIKNALPKLRYVCSTKASRCEHICKLFSTQASSTGKSVNCKLASENPKPFVPPSEPTPFPTAPSPVQTPVTEIPGPIPEPIFPQIEHQPDTKPPDQIPVPNQSAGKGANTEVMENDVLLQDVGDKGVIVLNRPKALNALNTSMVDKIYAGLIKWESSKKLVIIEGSGGKAFCAGGDVKTIITALNEPEGEIVGQSFFRKEYTLNHLIGTYKVPYVALLNGITMGGGVGLSVHGKYRVATENTLFAMPETAIGLFPDVGGTYFLPKLQGKLGLYLGLTGDRLKGVDVHLAGIATHFVPSERLPELKQELIKINTPNVGEILNKYHLKKSQQEFCLSPHLEQINSCFSASSVEQIIERLKKDGSEWAEKTIKTLLKMSPTSLKVTMSAIEKGKTLRLADALQMEYRLSYRVLYKNSDFYEGVRALLVDKDQNPKWNPKSLSEVTDMNVNQRFAPLPPEKELSLNRNTSNL